MNVLSQQNYRQHCAYRIMTSVCETEGAVCKQVYGVELINISDRDEKIRAFSDISACKEKVECLIERLEEYRVPAVHFDDIVEDYIEEIYGNDSDNFTK